MCIGGFRGCMGIWGLRERRVRSVRKLCGGIGLLTKSTFDCDTP